MKTLGYYGGSLDGLWGSQTYNAVQSYQSARGLSADGIVGTNTWTEMWQDVDYEYRSGAYEYYAPATSNFPDWRVYQPDDGIPYEAGEGYWYVRRLSDNNWHTSFSVYGPT